MQCPPQETCSLGTLVQDIDRVILRRLESALPCHQIMNSEGPLCSARQRGVVKTRWALESEVLGFSSIGVTS